MDDTYKTIEYRGFTINIQYDEDARSPREEFDNLGTLYTGHRNYRPEEDFNKNFDKEEVFDGKFGVFKKSFLKDYIALPVYLYDHSGQSVNTTGFSCKWDSGCFGIIAVSIDDVKKEYGWKIITSSRRKKIESYLNGEIETYDDYLQGNVYGFTIEDEVGNEIDSCWGYYGYDNIDYIEKECKETIDCALKQRRLANIQAKIDEIRRYGKQLLIPFFEFPEFISEPII